jgi:hypothetical protein
VTSLPKSAMQPLVCATSRRTSAQAGMRSYGAPSWIENVQQLIANERP